MPVGERRRAIPDAICELHGGAPPHSKAGPRVVSKAAVAAWWSQTESNRRHPACKAGALPTELWPLLRVRPGELSSTQAALKQQMPEAFALAPPERPGRPGQTRTADLTLIRRTL